MSWTVPGQGYFKSNLNESIDQIMRVYPRENIKTISALRDIAGGRGRDEGRTADAIANKFISYMMHVSQTDKKLHAKYKKMNFKDLFSKNLDKFKKVKGLNVYRIKSGSLKEDAAAAAELKAKQATEVERLKDKQEGENDALKMKHERENEQQKKKDEAEKEAEKNQAARESVEEAVLQGKDYVFDKNKKKVVISKDNYKKVQRDSKTTIKGVPYIMYNMGNQGTVLAPVHFEEVEISEENSLEEKIVATGDAISKIFKTKNKKEIDGIANLMSMTNVKVLQSMQKQNPKGFSRMAAKMGELPAMEEIEEKKKDMTAISSWKKKLKKVKGLSKDQMYMLTQLPTPVITSLINQIGMVVASNDMAEDGHTDVISAKNQVKIAMKALNTMNQELNKLNDEDELPSWWTNKVAVAVNKLDGMADYLDIKVESVRDIFKESDIKGLQEKAEKALKNKAKETGMPLGILRKVFQRGVKAWQSGHRPGTNAVQWGLARVNSFVTKGKGTWGKADSDLAAKVRKSEEIEEKAPDTDDAMKRYKAGKAGFTDKAHLKAKGLIPRADGTKRKSDKYK